jgi:UDP-N-acetylmuramoylalanine--D-glutamate ligase
VREYDGVKWFNDSKGTNVGATVAAIRGLGAELEGRLILIAGGVGKAADFSPLAPLIEQYVKHTVLFGQDASEIARIIKRTEQVSYAVNMQDAIMKAKSVAATGDYVLLSPACASFDMFRNYAHRGDVFTAIVNQL